VKLTKCGVAAAFTLALMSPAAVIYSNVTNFSGNGYAQGGATEVAGNDTTTMALDDITVAAGNGGVTVNSFTFSVANFNTTAVTAQPIVEFFDNNGASGGPGTLIASFAFTPISFTAGVVALFTSTGTFVVPAGGTFFAGVYFDDDNGTTGATAAQLNLLGQGIFAPPTVGSSQDSFFHTTGPGSAANNPAGAFEFFGGNPVADFGWAFSDAALATPEPGTGLLLLLAGVPLAWRRFRTKNGN
jgi:hypothetical protein